MSVNVRFPAYDQIVQVCFVLEHVGLGVRGKKKERTTYLELQGLLVLVLSCAQRKSYVRNYVASDFIQ